jgi:altronate dehydratase
LPPTANWRRKKHWIDFDAGQLIHGKAMPQLLEEFVDTIVDSQRQADLQ